MRLWDFLLQQVCFVEEKDGGGVLEPPVGEDGLEQGEALLESILIEKTGRGGKKKIRYPKDRTFICEQMSEETKAGCWWPYIVLALEQDLVVLADCRQVNDGGDVLEAMDPFPPLWTLATYIHHPGDTSNKNRCN